MSERDEVYARIVSDRPYQLACLMNGYNLSAKYANEIIDSTVLQLLENKADYIKLNRPYVLQAVKNNALTFHIIRNKKKGSQRYGNGANKYSMIVPTGLRERLDHAVEQEENPYTYKKLRKYIYATTPIKKEVLILRFAFNMSYKEIAIFLDIPYSTTRERLALAYKFLRRLKL